MAVSLEELLEGRRIAALVVRHCGDLYRPVFERLDDAITQLENTEDRLNFVLNSQAPIARVPRRTKRRVDRQTDARSLRVHRVDN